MMTFEVAFSMITIEHIPPLSAVALQVMRLDPQDPESSISKMEDLIKPDKGICAELLKIANSALYGRSGRMKTIRDAITLLGLKTVKNLVIMLSTKNMSGKLKNPLYRKYLHEFPVLSALTALDLCAPLNFKQMKDEAFLAALLHKIGMTVIAINKPGDYLHVLEQYEQGGMSLAALETAAFQTTHVKVGVMVFDVWKMPASNKDVMAAHEFDADRVGEQSDIVLVVALAGLIIGELMRFPSRPENVLRKEALVKRFNITEEKIAVFNDEYLENLKEHPFYQQVIA